MEDSKISRYKERIAAKIADFQSHMFKYTTEAEEIVDELDSLTTELDNIKEEIEIEIEDSEEESSSENELLKDYKQMQGEM